MKMLLLLLLLAVVRARLPHLLLMNHHLQWRLWKTSVVGFVR